MALIDEYKKAIQDVTDGRTKEPPRPCELPDTDDRLATTYMAAAAVEKAGAIADEKIAEIPSELPELPAEDGTYVLTCTVSGTIKTLSWESAGE